MNAIAEVSTLVDGIARSYARRAWWSDVEDLRQAGWVAGLEALRRFDPAKAPTGSIKPLARLRVKRTISRYLLANSTPVSSSDHGRYGLIGLRRADLEEIEGEPDERTAEGDLVFERWRAEVVVRLRAVVHDPEIVASLLDGEAPTTRAKKIAAIEAARKIKNDPELRRLWAEGP
jgi:DNA-directed RNA polymerase specialized sigma24 family protein